MKRDAGVSVWLVLLSVLALDVEVDATMSTSEVVAAGVRRTSGLATLHLVYVGRILDGLAGDDLVERVESRRGEQLVWRWRLTPQGRSLWAERARQVLETCGRPRR